MHKLILTVVLLIITSNVYGQNAVSPAHPESIAPVTARYEIVQGRFERFTFLLDKYTGNVKRLVRTDNDQQVWERMVVPNLPKTPSELRVRFQIFCGIAPRYNFLLDIDTGQTWELVRKVDEKQNPSYVWVQMKDKE
jgi:hypothetical protein